MKNHKAKKQNKKAEFAEQIVVSESKICASKFV